MARPKGQGKTPGSGRQPGSENKVTRETKEVIADLLKLTAPIYAKLLIEKAESGNADDRAEFMSRFEKLIEFDVPKLQRSNVDLTSNGKELTPPVFNFMPLDTD